MTWARIDDGWPRHPKMVAAGLHGRALWVTGVCYCAANLTDGIIAKAALPIIAIEAGVKPSTAAKLVEVGSWHDHGDSFEVHDYLDYNPSREKVIAEREAAAERQRKARESRRDRQRDSQGSHNGSNGVSSPSPTRPVVPTELTDAATTPPKRGTRLPDDFVVDASLNEWAAKECPTVNVERETEQWRDYHRAKGDTAKDWSASWRTWMRNARKWDRNPEPVPTVEHEWGAS